MVRQQRATALAMDAAADVRPPAARKRSRTKKVRVADTKPTSMIDAHGAIRASSARIAEPTGMIDAHGASRASSARVAEPTIMIDAHGASRSSPTREMASAATTTAGAFSLWTRWDATSALEDEHRARRLWLATSASNDEDVSTSGAASATDEERRARRLWLATSPSNDEDSVSSDSTSDDDATGWDYASASDEQGAIRC